MTPQELANFARYVDPGKTLCRFVTDDPEYGRHESLGIIMENAPHAYNDSEWGANFHFDGLSITWFDTVDPATLFPSILIELYIEAWDGWYDVDDILMFEEPAL